ncbi:MAG: phage baseplate protein [Christensenellales bacterium]
MEFIFDKQQKCILSDKILVLPQGEHMVTTLLFPLDIDPSQSYKCCVEFKLADGTRYTDLLEYTSDGYKYVISKTITAVSGRVDLQLVLYNKESDEIYKTFPVCGKIRIKASVNANQDLTGIIVPSGNLSNLLDEKADKEQVNEIVQMAKDELLLVMSNYVPLSQMEQVVQTSSQSFSETQKDIVRTNIGAITALDVYPVGAVYISMSNVSPSELFGGEWVRIMGRFLLAATDTTESDSYVAGDYPAYTEQGGTVSTVGGEENHTLTVSEMPSHNHKIRKKTSPGVIYTGEVFAAESTEWSTEEEITESLNVGMIKTGSGAAHNNMPPFIAVYMWQRVS